MTTIHRCYDSHVHLLAVGEVLCQLDLRGLSNLGDLSKLKIEKDFFRAGALVGFGWDQHVLGLRAFPTRWDLDRAFPHFPVFFSRVDGHALWVNSQVIDGLSPEDLKQLSHFNDEVLRDPQGNLLGVFLDRAMDIISKKIPDLGDQQKQGALLSAFRNFQKNGFTHVRDLSCDQDQWNILSQLDQKGRCSLYVDENFSVEKSEQFDRVLADALYAQKHPEKHLRAQGLKFYLDGALGSEGAAISQPYGGTQKKGILLWSSEQIRDWMHRTWSQRLEVSVHVIGDRASNLLVDVASALNDRGIRGVLNLEHAEIMDPNTIYRLSCLKQVRVHMQPCHWLSDRRWLKTKLGDLEKNAFPWAALEENNIPISWGSDAPIEPPSVFRTLQALLESARQGVRAPEAHGLKWHQHPDFNWGPDCFTTLDDGKIGRVVFDGRILED